MQLLSLMLAFFILQPIHAGNSVYAEAVRRKMKDNLKDFRVCYETGLKQSPTMAGKVVFGFVVDREGNVSESKILSSELGIAEVESCLLARLKTINFDPPLDAEKADIKYPMVFKTSRVNLAGE